MYLKKMLSWGLLLSSVGLNASQLSPSGYSGAGLIPSATTLTSGSAVLAYDPTIPGAVNSKGYNTQIGLGLTDNFEFTGRLATNDLKCNAFIVGACPANNIRDLSASFKVKLPSAFLQERGVDIAVGATDFGGAASRFKSYYGVVTKNFGPVDVTVGSAKAIGSESLLKGFFSGVSYQVTNYSSVSLQQAQKNTVANLSVKGPTVEGIDSWVSFNHRISRDEAVSKNWIGWGLSIPMGVASLKNPKTIVSTTTEAQTSSKKLETLENSQELEALESKGFYNPRVGYRRDGSVLYQLDATSYQWNILDAAGVALGVLASVHSSSNQERNFELLLARKGINQLYISGEVQCLAKWLQYGEYCSKLKVSSTIQNHNKEEVNLDGVAWKENSAWLFRPEIALSPRIVSSIGTEYGAFDADLGVDITTVLPLWRGASIENNRVRSLGVGTKNFEAGGLFYYSRILPGTTRELFHQVVSLPSLNTQARYSRGKINTNWSGTQIETSTQSDNGVHRVGVVDGSFKDTLYAIGNQRNYHLVSYRFVNDRSNKYTTEITTGKFWGGDKGFSIAQKFWHDDVAVSLYVRRSRVLETVPFTSFAGIELSLPFTPRENRQLKNISLQGSSQWTYALETKILEKENRITGGFGSIPKVGENLTQMFNRDRNSTPYYEHNLTRVRESFLALY
jgi:hypothetical protein